MNKIFKNSIFNTIYTLLNVTFPIITSMYISRVLLPHGVGVVSYAQTTVSYFVAFASSGISIYAIREFAKAREDKEERNKVFTELFVFNVITSSIALVAYCVMVFVIGEFRSELMLYFCCGLLIIFQFINIDWMYQGLEQYGYITVRSFVVKTASFICILLFVKTKEDYVIYALISSLAIGSNNVFNIIHARKYVRLVRNISLKKHIAPIVYIALCVYLSAIYNKVDVSMLGIITTKESVGYYSYAHRIIEIVITLCVSVSTVFMPQMSVLYGKDKEKFERLVDIGIRVLLFISVPAAVGIFILAPQTISLMLGASFIPASATVRILTAMIIIKPMANLLCYQLIISTGNERKRLPAFIIAVVLNIGLNSFMIPLWQHNGAALASVISELAINTVLVVIIAKLVHIRVDIPTLLKVLAATALMAVPVVCAVVFIKSTVWQLVVGAVGGTIVYIGANALLKNSIMMMVFKKIASRFKKKKQTDEQ